MTKRKVVNVSKPIDAPVSGTSALKPHAEVNNIKSKQKVRILKRKYVKPQARNGLFELIKDLEEGNIIVWKN